MKAYIQFCMFLSGPGKFIYFIEYSFSRTRFIHRPFYRTPLISLMSFHLLIGDKRLTRDNVDNSSTLETYFQQLTHYEPIGIRAPKNAFSSVVINIHHDFHQKSQHNLWPNPKYTNKIKLRSSWLLSYSLPSYPSSSSSGSWPTSPSSGSWWWWAGQVACHIPYPSLSPGRR